MNRLTLTKSTQGYDRNLELLCSLGVLAKRGLDVNGLLINAVDANLSELVTAREFQVALGVAERPAL